jgi:hypothetical protein
MIKDMLWDLPDWFRGSGFVSGGRESVQMASVAKGRFLGFQVRRFRCRGFISSAAITKG